MTAKASEFDSLIARADSAMAAGNAEGALALIDRALDLRPRDVDALNSKGALLGRAKRFEETAATFELAALERPDSAELQYNIAFALQSQRRAKEALVRYDRALALKRDYPEALTNRALTLVALGRYEEAIASAQAAIQIGGSDPRYFNNLGHALFKLRNFDAAQRAFEVALRYAPNYVDARSNLARCLVATTRMEEALPHLETVLAASPGHGEAVESLSVALRALERYSELATTCDRLTKQAPSAVSPWLELGATLATLNRAEEAKACFEKAIELDPQDARTHARFGQSLLELGELEAAKASFAKACELDPTSAYFIDLRIGLEIPPTDDGTLAALQAMEARTDEFDLNDRAHVHFALAKLLGDTDASFSHLLEGNRIERGRRSYDEAATLAMFAAIGERTTPKVIERCRSGGDPSQNPIFILGMPRSGSTLVEQILAAHQNVLALGELKSFHQAVQAIDAKKGATFPEWLEQMNAEDVRALADTYKAKIRGLAAAQGQTSADVRLVDKSPGNFRNVGLIHLALPNARIIHTRRDPVDTCLSCFRHLFADVPFSYDLGELGRYCAAYERLMQRWSELLPADAILHVDHEELVADFEGVARRIVAYCGLEWDDACLSFQDVKRPVRTVSAAQVRQPLKAGRKPWRPSDERLRPLLEGLGRV